MTTPVTFVVPRHAVPSDPETGLSPLQARMLDDPTPIRIFSAPTGAGKSFAFQKGMRDCRDRILFVVPTRRLAQNLAEGLKTDLTLDGLTEEKVLNQVFLWTSDERRRQEEENPEISTRDRRIRQIRQGVETETGGLMIIATLESVALVSSEPAQTNDGMDPENLLDLLRLTHVVFDEFHTIQARGMGIAYALATMTSRIIGTARVTFLSATPINLKTSLADFGIPEDQILVENETVVTGSAEETSGMRAIHGDVEITIEMGNGLLNALDIHRDLILNTLSRTDDGHQVVLVYDSVRQLLADKRDLADWFDRIEVGPKERLAVNSVDDSVGNEMGELFTIGRDTDPRKFRVLVATSSIEMGVTFKAGLILMEPGHDACSFVQRIGRVARGDLDGNVVVHVNSSQHDRHAWLRQLVRDIEKAEKRVPVEQFIDLVLGATRARFDATSKELAMEDGMFRRMPQSAIWCAGLFWVALNESAPYKGNRDTLWRLKPKQAGIIGSHISVLQKSSLDSAQCWAKAFLDEAKKLRMILPKVRLIDPSGNKKSIPWHLYASTEELIDSPCWEGENEILEVSISRPISAVEAELGGLRARRQEDARMPHRLQTKRLPLKGIRETWLRAVDEVMMDPGLMPKQEQALEAARMLVRLTGIVPVLQEQRSQMMETSSSDLGEWADPVLKFRDIVEKHDLHGLPFQHLDICKRRAWFHMNRINYAHLDARMQLGSVSHELHRPRDHSVEGLMGIAPDRIDWDRREVTEAKGSAGARRAVSIQTRFYALMLMAATGQRWSAVNEIIGGRKRLPVPIDLSYIREMVDMAERLGEMSAEPMTPSAVRKPICASCSYRFLCGFL